MKIMTDIEKEYYSDVKKMFDAAAHFYDIGTAVLSRLRSRVVDFTNAETGSTILDVGTGTGKQVFAFAKKGYEVIGCDLSEVMIKVANRKNRFANAKFEVADAADLPYGDNSLDVSCASLVLHEMPVDVRERVLKEMVRVTKPNGTIVIVDWGLPANRIGRFLIYHIVNSFECKYYSPFIKSDLGTTLRKFGIEPREELSVLLGAGRILKGIKVSG